MNSNRTNRFDSIGRRSRSAHGTVSHSQTYWCAVEGSRSVRAHRAEGRHRVPGMTKQIALCAAHAEEWKSAGLVARRSGPRGGAA